VSSPALRRVHRKCPIPRTPRGPSMWFLTTSTVCSTHGHAGLLHPAVDHEVRRVSSLERPPDTEVSLPVRAIPRDADLSPRRTPVLDSGTASLRPMPPCRWDQLARYAEASLARSPLDFEAFFHQTRRSDQLWLPAPETPLFSLGFLPLRGRLTTRRRSTSTASPQLPSRSPLSRHTLESVLLRETQAPSLARWLRPVPNARHGSPQRFACSA